MYSTTIDERRCEMRRLLEGMKAEPGRRQMNEARRFIAIQRSLAVEQVAMRAPQMTLG